MLVLRYQLEFCEMRELPNRDFKTLLLNSAIKKLVTIQVINNKDSPKVHLSCVRIFDWTMATDKYSPVCYIKGRFVTGRLKLKLKTINRLTA